MPKLWRRGQAEMNPFPRKKRVPKAAPTIKELAKAAQTERERRKEQAVPLSAWERYALIKSLTRKR